MTKFEREVICVVGKTGQGKTFWTRRYLRTRRRVIIQDPMLEYDGLLFDDTEKLLDHVEKNRFYQVRSEFAEDAPDLAAIAMAAGDCRKRGRPMPHPGCVDVCLVIDEAGRALPSGGRIDPAIADVIYRGRHRHVTLVNVTQRASTLHIAARSQWTRLITFWQTEDNDTKWIQNQAGEKLPVQSLRPLEYYDITPRGIKKCVIEPDDADDAVLDADTSDTEDRETETV